jgi:hypothetical protein
VVLDRLETLSGAVRRRALMWGWGSVAIGLAVWIVVVWDPWHADRSAWWPAAIAIVLPGLAIIWFAGRIGRLRGVTRHLDEELHGLTEATRRARRDVRGTGLRALLGVLRDLGDEGADARRAIADVAGTGRVFNPVVLAIVALAAAGTGLVALGGVVVLFVAVL